MNAVSSASPTKVLVVEDDPATVDFVRLYLERDGHEVFYALDGLEGLRLAREEKPDLIVLDIMLPKLDGMEIYPAPPSRQAASNRSVAVPVASIRLQGLQGARRKAIVLSTTNPPKSVLLRLELASYSPSRIRLVAED